MNDAEREISHLQLGPTTDTGTTAIIVERVSRRTTATRGTRACRYRIDSRQVGGDRPVGSAVRSGRRGVDAAMDIVVAVALVSKTIQLALSTVPAIRAMTVPDDSSYIPGERSYRIDGVIEPFS